MSNANTARTDVHQDLWGESLVAALAARTSPPRAGRIRGGLELVLSAEPSSPLTPEDPARRAALLAAPATPAPARLFGWTST